MKEYDSYDHRRFAGRLVLIAHLNVFVWMLVGFGFGIISGGGAFVAVQASSLVAASDKDVYGMILGIVVFVFFVIAGYLIGDWRSFRLKLEAQNSLCLADIRDALRSVNRQ
jgi:hypothetical protein